jgi:hypothetical protein
MMFLKRVHDVLVGQANGWLDKCSLTTASSSLSRAQCSALQTVRRRQAQTHHDTDTLKGLLQLDHPISPTRKDHSGGKTTPQCVVRKLFNSELPALQQQAAQ